MGPTSLKGRGEEGVVVDDASSSSALRGGVSQDVVWRATSIVDAMMDHVIM